MESTKNNSPQDKAINLLWFLLPDAIKYCVPRIPWFFIVSKLTGFIGHEFKFIHARKWLYPIIFISLFIAPVADEIIGGFQFRALCSDKAMLVYDEESVRNKILLYSPLSKVNIKNTIIPIEVTISGGMNIVTGETVLKYKTYRATGGWLSRTIAFNNVTRPFTFHGVCGVKNQLSQLEKELNIKATFK